MSIVITAGQRGASPQFEVVLVGQGVCVLQEPHPPAASRYPLHHSGQGRPGPQPLVVPGGHGSMSLGAIDDLAVCHEATILVAAVSEWR